MKKTKFPSSVFITWNFKHDSICGSVAESVECALLVRRVPSSIPADDFVNGDESHAGFKNSGMKRLSPVGILMPRVLTTFLSSWYLNADHIFVKIVLKNRAIIMLPLVAKKIHNAKDK